MPESAQNSGPPLSRKPQKTFKSSPELVCQELTSTQNGERPAAGGSRAQPAAGHGGRSPHQGGDEIGSLPETEKYVSFDSACGASPAPNCDPFASECGFEAELGLDSESGLKLGLGLEGSSGLRRRNSKVLVRTPSKNRLEDPREVVLSTNSYRNFRATPSLKWQLRQPLNGTDFGEHNSEFSEGKNGRNLDEEFDGRFYPKAVTESGTELMHRKRGGKGSVSMSAPLAAHYVPAYGDGAEGTWRLGSQRNNFALKNGGEEPHRTEARASMARRASIAMHKISGIIPKSGILGRGEPLPRVDEVEEAAEEKSDDLDFESIPALTLGEAQSSFWNIAQGGALLLLGAALVTTAIFGSLRNTKLIGVALWRWLLLLLVIVSGRLMSGWCMMILIRVIEKQYLLRQRVLYFVYGLRHAVRNLVWLALVIAVWNGLFHSYSDARVEVISRLLWCFFAALAIRVLEVSGVKYIANSFHRAAYFDRIQDALFHQYVLESLSSPPLDSTEDEGIWADELAPFRAAFTVSRPSANCSANRGKEINKEESTAEAGSTIELRSTEGDLPSIVDRSTTNGFHLDADPLRDLNGVDINGDPLNIQREKTVDFDLESGSANQKAPPVPASSKTELPPKPQHFNSTIRPAANLGLAKGKEHSGAQGSNQGSENSPKRGINSYGSFDSDSGKNGFSVFRSASEREIRDTPNEPVSGFIPRSSKLGVSRDMGQPRKQENLQNLTSQTVSAWTMKKLMSKILKTKISTYVGLLDDEMEAEIDSELQAKAAAKHIFDNVSQPGQTHLTLQDFERFLVEEHAAKAFVLFEGAESGRVGRRALMNWVVSAYKERKALALTLSDSKTVVSKLQNVLDMVMLVLLFVVSLLIIGVNTSRLLILFSSLFIPLVFVFGNQAKITFEALIFLFIMHPFDVGDRIMVDGASYVVEEINVLYTVLLNGTSEKVYWPNDQLKLKAVSNVYRSPHQWDVFEFDLPLGTSLEKVNQLKERLQVYFDVQPQLYYPSFRIVCKEANKAFNMAVWFQHRVNWQEYTERFQRRSNTIFHIRSCITELGLDEPPPPPTQIIAQLVDDLSASTSTGPPA